MCQVGPMPVVPREVVHQVIQPRIGFLQGGIKRLDAIGTHDYTSMIVLQSVGFTTE